MATGARGIGVVAARARALARRTRETFGDPSRAWRFCGSALAVLALAGCGTALRVAYNQGDIAVRLAAHEYFDLHGEQSEAFKAQLKAFHAWHRTEELPKYADLLEGMALRVQRGLTREDVQWASAAVRERVRVLAAQAVDDAGPVLVMLDADNTRALEKKLAASNAKFAGEYLSGDPRKDERNRARRIRENFEDWFGDLSDEQEGLIEVYVRASPRITAAMFEDRKRRQRELVELLKAYRSNPEITARVRAFVVDWEASRGPEYARLAREQEERFTELLLSMDRTLSPRQRRHAVDRLTLYAREFAILAGQGRGAPKGTQRASLALEPAR